MKQRHKIRLAVAAVGMATRNPKSYIRQAARLAVEQQASRRISAIPEVELVDLAPVVNEISVKLAPRETRHGWSLGAMEQLCLQVLIRSRGCQTSFEIGTFNGGTTLLIAETLPEHGQVYTLDLPRVSFDSTQHPAHFSGASVGAAYRGSPSARKITQLYGDSLGFDFGPFEHWADLVLVDGGHEYENGLADSYAALRVVRDGGIILWDDFESYWYGLVNGVCDAMKGRALRRVAGTALAAYEADSSRSQPL